MDLAAGPTVPSRQQTNGNGKSSISPLRRSAEEGGSPEPGGYLCTVTMEDYFHAAPLRPWIRADTWHRFDSRLADSTARTLDFLGSCGVEATFFVGREIVRGAPELVRTVAAAGHELAVRGDLDCRPADLGPAETLERARTCRDELEGVTGRQVLGYRASGGWLRPDELWLLEVLGEAGYAYDSSMRPVLLSNPLAALARQPPESNGRAGVREIALSSVNVCGLAVPIGGGAALRLLPQAWVRRAVATWRRRGSEPYVMYLRPWELDPDQPRVQSASTAVRLRQYRNLERMPARLRSLLTAHPFESVASYLQLSPSAVAPKARANGSSHSHARATAAGMVTDAPGRTSPSVPAMPVTVVIPCYNETQSLPYLDRALADLTGSFAGTYDFRFLFVDDRSTDQTWAMLQSRFGHRGDCMLVRHERNRGIAAAIGTGLLHATTDVVCSIDCDCTYDPRELGNMIPLLRDGVDVVTASPYHPSGGVRNVPGWRLVLSKTLSRLYRLVLRQKLFTYTSCFRVYRKETAVALHVNRSGFLGIAEMIAQLDLAGRRVVEYPTTLEVRVLGHSKMKVLHTIWGHIGLLLEVARARVRRLVSATAVSL